MLPEAVTSLMWSWSWAIGMHVDRDAIVALSDLKRSFRSRKNLQEDRWHQCRTVVATPRLGGNMLSVSAGNNAEVSNPR
jgi:hypothetical protein